MSAKESISDEELLKRIIAADEEAFEKGVSPQGRWLPVIESVMSSLGYKGFFLAGSPSDPLVDRISAIHGSLYRPSDLAISGIHGGVFMFRGVFTQISIPIAYGKVEIKPTELTDLAPNQLAWLSSRKVDVNAFYDQFTDIFDFAGGLENFADYKKPSESALELFRLAAFQLQASAATLCAAFDCRGAIQSALIGVELALKAGLAEHDVTENERKKLGHDLVLISKAYHKLSSSFEIDRVLYAIERFPDFVKNRYNTEQPNRIETGHIVMCAQYIAGEVMRQVTGFSIRENANPPQDRTYPAL